MDSTHSAPLFYSDSMKLLSEHVSTTKKPTLAIRRTMVVSDSFENNTFSVKFLMNVLHILNVAMIQNVITLVSNVILPNSLSRW